MGDSVNKRWRDVQELADSLLASASMAASSLTVLFNKLG